ncbi:MULTISPECIES: hypothetical protein [unclassified Streptomyces]|uniref:hypothetical protein n=1 Tax=unclassified Streptomyces TaxID=2593676 RepID=UPI003419E4CC
MQKQGVRRALSVLSVAALAAAACLIGAPSASADSKICIDAGRVCAEWQSYGDKLIVHDYAADGIGGVAFIYDESTYVGYCMNQAGAAAPPVTCNYNFPESDQVRYKVCTEDNGKSTGLCTDYWTDRA